MKLIDLAEKRWLSDSMVRSGMRRLMAKRLKTETAKTDDEQAERLQAFIAELDASPIAVETDAANRQHYEVPAEFFRLHLGPRLKYSCCLYATGRENIAGAEEAMLANYADRANLGDHQRILDLGCGWGSFALWAAARFPTSSIVALTNSESQRAFIEALAAERKLTNLQVVVGNIVDFEFDAGTIGPGFDRIVSIEMLEHMKNYRKLFAKLAGWLVDDGRVFVHVFANRHVAYHFEDKDPDDWMSRYFFTGGTMPSFDLFKSFDEDLVVEKRWWVSGRHYERTADEWLRKLDANEDAVLDLFEGVYGVEDAKVWLARWRMFYMAVCELFGYDAGKTWGVGHYRFVKKSAATEQVGA